MKQKYVNRQINVGIKQHESEVVRERALGDDTFQCRPLWCCPRPDHQHGPRLTLAARQLLREEANHAANSHD